MTSHATRKFWDCYAPLPDKIKKRARKAYSLFKENPSHPSLRFKKIVTDPPIYSVRITRSYRALGVKKDDVMIWFWIGSHDEYERMIAGMR